MNESLSNALVAAAEREMLAANSYLAAATMFSWLNCPQTEALMLAQAEEEFGHRLKVEKFLRDNGINFVITVTGTQASLQNSPEKFADLRVKLEQLVLDGWNDVATQALKENRHDVYQVALEFAAGQTEEINSAQIFRQIWKSTDTLSQKDHLTAETFED